MKTTKETIIYTCLSCNKLREVRLQTILKNVNYLKKCVQCTNKEKVKKTMQDFDWSKRSQKSKQTWLEKYGVEHPSQLEEVKIKKSKTYQSNFKRNNENLKSSIHAVWADKTKKEEILKKRKDTYNKIYGKDAYTQTESYKTKNREAWDKKSKEELQSIFEKRKKALIDKYGKDYKQVVMNSYKATCLERYGVEYPHQLEAVKEKTKRTCLEKYGVECYTQSDLWKKDIREATEKGIFKASTDKSRKTCLEKYGVENAYLIPSVIEHRRGYYKYDNVLFDSKPELAFYVYCKDAKLPIKRNTSFKLDFLFENKIIGYYPDFEINGEYFEIKGKQFLKEDGTWQNPFDHSQDELYEAKHQCALRNNVHLIYNYDMYLQYMKEIYGSEFFELCKKN